jgi:hypothetical protein
MRSAGGAVILRRGFAVAMLAILTWGAPSWAQSQGAGLPDELAPLRHGPLIVWFLQTKETAPQSNLDAIAALHHATPLTYQEQTAGSFGQTSSSYGQTAGSYGVDSSTPTISTPKPAQGEDAPSATPNGIGYKEQEAGTFGQTSSSYGTESSDHGQTASSYGQNAGSFGTAASNHGQTASSYGVSTSAIPGAGDGSGKPGTVAAHHAAVEHFIDRLRQAFPELQANFYEVDPAELKARLTAARGTSAYPDVLLGTLPEVWWKELQGQYGVAMLRPAEFYQNGVTSNLPRVEDFAILMRAPHMQAAHAFAIWMSEPNAGCPGCVQAQLSAKERAATTVALGAMDSLLHNQPITGYADPAMADGLAPGMQKMLTTTANTVAADASFHVEVERVSVNGSVAAVVLRVLASSTGVFGVAHPLMILRAQKDGQWKVLQVSLNLPQFEAANVRATLMETSPTAVAEQRGGVKGVALASPQDGVTGTPRPELVWDNEGGAGLQVVEWQMDRGDGWTDARLYLVQDHSPRLQTHVIAEFAGTAGSYRWRVWSVGMQGEMTISTWRGFGVVQ